jgi:UDP-N-acetylmuramate: L-alanyl-gamma-D-glutamyl-meso-diaminopimelate ligase
MNSKEIQTIYIIAICGTGMASLAGLLQKAGYRVTGSDANVYPPMSTLLENAGIEIKPGYKKENITGEIDLVVVGNAVSKDNEEVLAVQAADIPYISMPQALSRFFLEGRKSLVVTGTHGKTTTSAMLSWVFESCGQNPGFMVGGWLKNFDTNHKLPRDDWFITEGDEYDTAFFDKGPKFLHYQPYAAILTSIEFDHADIFRDLDHIKEAFRKFMKLIDPKGFLLVEFSDKNTKDVINKAQCEVETYGFSEEADWQVADYRFADGHGQFTLNHHGKEVGRFHLPMIGRHNILNSAAVTALALKCGLSADAVAKGLKEFKGIKRRQEVVGEKNGVTVIDDFAHHPTAIHLTLEGAKDAWPGHRIWAVFEPRSATSRRKVFEESLPESFRLADQTIIANLFAPDKLQEEERLDPKQVVASIKKKGREAWFFPTVEEIIDFIAEHQQPGDVVMIMSSGGFDGIHQKLLDRL